MFLSMMETSSSFSKGMRGCNCHLGWRTSATMLPLHLSQWTWTSAWVALATAAHLGSIFSQVAIAFFLHFFPTICYYYSVNWFKSSGWFITLFNCVDWLLCCIGYIPLLAYWTDLVMVFIYLYPPELIWNQKDSEHSVRERSELLQLDRRNWWNAGALIITLFQS